MSEIDSEASRVQIGAEAHSAGESQPEAKVGAIEPLVCLTCGALLPERANPRGRPARYCGPACRRVAARERTRAEWRAQIDAARAEGFSAGRRAGYRDGFTAGRAQGVEEGRTSAQPFLAPDTGASAGGASSAGA